MDLGFRGKVAVITGAVGGMGEESARMMTTDLTKRYVEINSEYTT